MITEELVSVNPEETSIFHPPSHPQLNEHFTRKLQNLFARLNAHKKATTLLSNATKKVVKFCESFPDFEALSANKEELALRLHALFTRLGKSVDGNLTVNDLFAFHSHHEADFFFATPTRFLQLTLAQFAVLLLEFSGYLEHAFAVEQLFPLDQQLASATKELPLLAGLKFQGLNFKYFWKARLLIEKMVRVLGVQGATEKLAAVDLLGYAEEHFSLRSLMKLTRAVPNYATQKCLFSHFQDHPLVQLPPDQISEDHLQFAHHPLFSAAKLLENIRSGAKPEVLQPAGLQSLFTQPADKDQSNFAQILAANVLGHPDFQLEFVKQAEMSLRISTCPNINGRELMDIFDRNYPLKRLQALNPKRASCLLLYKLAKEQPSDCFEVEVAHLKTKNRFRNHLVEFLRRGFLVEESELARSPDDVKRHNRRWNKIFERAAALVADKFIDLYLGFYFDLAVRRSFLHKSVQALKEVANALCVYPVWKSVALAEVSRKDLNTGVFDKYHNIVVELTADLQRVVFSFWKGCRLYEEHTLLVQEIDYDHRNIKLAEDHSMTSLVTDFRPCSVVIVANSKETYFLRSKVVAYTAFCNSENNRAHNKVDFFVYFLRSPLLEFLAKANAAGPWNTARVYNAYCQNPLLTFLSLFSRDAEPASLFAPSKLDLKNDFNCFLLRLTVFESICEKGICVTDMLRCNFGDFFIDILGFQGTHSEVRQAWNHLQLERAAGNCSFDINQRQNWTTFSKRQGLPASLTLFRRESDSEELYFAVKSKLEQLPHEMLRTFVESFKKVLDFQSSQGAIQEKMVLNSLLPNHDVYSTALLARRVLVELRVSSNRKLHALHFRLSAPDYEIRVARSLFKGELLLRHYAVVDFTVTHFDKKFIRGRIGRFFSGVLFVDDIGHKALKGKQIDLANFFSLNQTFPVLVKEIHPELLRLDVSISSEDILSMRGFLDVHRVLKKYRLEQGSNFLVDQKKDVPFFSEFEKVERNFDFFRVEHPALRNFNLAEAKIFLRDHKATGFLFKPSQRNKSSFFELIMHIAKIDSFVILPVYVGTLGDNDLPQINESPLKYAKENLETTCFIYGKHHFDGLTALIDCFVAPLLANLNRVFHHEKFTSLPKSAIKDNFESADAVLADNTPGELSFEIRKHSVAELTFKLYYKDSKRIFGHKLLRVDHLGFTLLEKFASLDALLADFTKNAKEPLFNHDQENMSAESILSAIDDSPSVISVASIDCESSSFFKGKHSNFKRRDGGQDNASRRDVRNHSEQGRPDGQRPQFKFQNRRPGNFENANQPPAEDHANTNAPSWGASNNMHIEEPPTWGEQRAPFETAPHNNVQRKFGKPPDAPAWGTSQPEKKTQSPAAVISTKELETPSWGNPSKEQEAPSWGAPTKQPETPSWGAPATKTAESGWGVPGDANSANNQSKPTSETGMAPEHSFVSNEAGQSRSFGGPRDSNNFQRDQNNSGFGNRPQGFNRGGEGGFGDRRNNAPRTDFRAPQKNNEGETRSFGGNNRFDGGNQRPRNENGPGGFNRPVPNDSGSGGLGASKNNEDTTGNDVPSWGNNTQKPADPPSWGGNKETTETTPSWGAPQPTEAKTTPTFSAPKPEGTVAPNENPTPSWGQPAPSNTTTPAPSWGQPTPTSTATPAPSWGQPTLSESTSPMPTASTPAQGWGTPNTNDDAGSSNGNQPPAQGRFNNARGDGNRFNNRPPSDQNNSFGGNQGRPNNFRDRHNTGQEGGQGSGYQPRPPRDFSGNNNNAGPGNRNNYNNRSQGEGGFPRGDRNTPNPHSDSNNAPQSDSSTVPSWGNNASTNNAPTPSWGKNKPTEAPPTWGNTAPAETLKSLGSREQTKPDTTPGWGNAPKTPSQIAESTPSWGNKDDNPQTPAPAWGEAKKEAPVTQPSAWTQPSTAPTTAPAWRAPVEANAPTPISAVPGNNPTADSKPSWDAPKPASQESGEWKSNPPQRNNSSFGRPQDGNNNRGNFAQGGDRPPRNDNYQQNRFNNNDNKGSFNRQRNDGNGFQDRGPSQDQRNNRPNNNSLENKSPDQPTAPGWGNTPTAPVSTPTWGNSTATNEAPAPSWGSSKADQPVPSWGNPTPAATEKTTPTWGQSQSSDAKTPLALDQPNKGVSGNGDFSKIPDNNPAFASANDNSRGNSGSSQQGNNRDFNRNYNGNNRGGNQNEGENKGYNNRGNFQNNQNRGDNFGRDDRGNNRGNRGGGDSSNQGTTNNNAVPAWGKPADAPVAESQPTWGNPSKTETPAPTWGNQPKTESPAPGWGGSALPRASENPFPGNQPPSQPVAQSWSASPNAVEKRPETATCAEPKTSVPVNSNANAWSPNSVLTEGNSGLNENPFLKTAEMDQAPGKRGIDDFGGKTELEALRIAPDKHIKEGSAPDGPTQELLEEGEILMEWKDQSAQPN